MTLDRGAFYKEKSIWNRQAYMGLFREKKITAVVRIGDRSGTIVEFGVSISCLSV